MQKKYFTLKQLCKNLDVEIYGDECCEIDHVCTIQAGNHRGIAFLMNPQYRKYLATTSASAVILSSSELEQCSVSAIVSRDPYFTCSQIAAFFDDKPQLPTGIHSSTVVGKNCKINSSVRIGPNCIIGDHVDIAEDAIISAGCVVGDFCVIGKSSKLEANVTLYHRVNLGKQVQIASGAVIGSDGFGLAKHKGIWHKIPQLGSVVLGDNVEIGANSTVDRGAIEDTIIGDGTKIDNQVQVAHNVSIGKHTAIAGCVGIAGSTSIGDNCMVGGQAGFAGHLTIADDVAITGGTEVTKSIREPGIYSSGIGGLVTNKVRQKNTARVNRLGRLFQKIKKLEEDLNILKERDDS